MDAPDPRSRWILILPARDEGSLAAAALIRFYSAESLLATAHRPLFLTFICSSLLFGACCRSLRLLIRFAFLLHCNFIIPSFSVVMALTGYQLLVIRYHFFTILSLVLVLEGDVKATRRLH